MAQVMRIGGLKRVGLLLGVCAALLLGAMSHSSYALTLNSTPDIYVDGITVSYNSTSDAFLAYGSAKKYNGVDLMSNIYFNLNATIDSSGHLMSGGSMYVYDYNLPDYLIKGNLTGLDFTLGDPVLNFLFTTTGGSYQSEYGSLGGIILGASGFGLSGFANDFGTISASADIGTPVPEPSTVCLLLLGVGGLFFVRRRKA